MWFLGVRSFGGGDSGMRMDAEQIIPALKALIVQERGKGCPMAVDLFIEPALRRWRSYDRRLRRHSDKSLEHRAQDLESGLLDWYTEHYGLGYDPGCIHHLAHSFAEILFHGAKTIPEGTSQRER